MKYCLDDFGVRFEPKNDGASWSRRYSLSWHAVGCLIQGRDRYREKEVGGGENRKEGLRNARNMVLNDVEVVAQVRYALRNGRPNQNAWRGWF